MERGLPKHHKQLLKVYALHASTSEYNMKTVILIEINIRLAFHKQHAGTSPILAVREGHYNVCEEATIATFANVNGIDEATEKQQIPTTIENSIIN